MREKADKKHTVDGYSNKFKAELVKGNTAEFETELDAVK